MAEEGSLPDELKLSSLPDPGDRYVLGDLLGAGVCGEVFEANDTESGGRRVAIKIQRATPDNEEDLRSEYQVLKELSGHPNLPDLYGVYLKKAPSSSDEDKLWFVMELCEGGPATDLVRGLQEKNRRMSEEHIAYILKEIVKVLVHLHENHVMHRDVKGSNILLTKDGEVKLVDFGLSRKLKNAQDKRGTYVGSPCWMAPEVVASGYKDEDKVYDSRIDVWALGITAIELADGKAPFLDMHPTRALFQIVRNPPPNLYRPANWTQDFNDFITECLEKNPEHRPYIMELLEHPFITGLPENDFHLSTELKMLIEDFAEKGKPNRKTEVVVRNGLLKEGLSATPEPMRQEDLAALEKPSEDTILVELQSRLQEGHCHTFVGDVLLVLNPNEQQDIYGDEVHAKYRFKARSDNAPHIFSVADKAYQDALHHEEPQYVLLAGETLAGKTTNMLHLLQHLLYLGQGPNKIGSDVTGATSVVHALGNAATPSNPNSTRHVLQLELAFTPTGKVSSATFWLYQLEKWRVTDHRRGQANFHVFYYFYDGLEASGRLEEYNLDGGRKYRYLRTQKVEGSIENILGVREDPEGNVQKFREFEENLKQLGFQDEQLHTLYSLLAAILVLGEIRFQEGDDNDAEVGNPDVAAKVANLLGVDEKKFSWALINYCAVQKGTAVRRRHTRREAEEARDVLARGIYSRLVDWVVNVINYKLSFTRAIFGDKYSITLMDLFGFECFKNNGMEQLFVNTLNEQLQYHYNQRVFAWEMQEQEEEEIPVQTLEYFDNKMTVDELMAKQDGFLYLLDEASRTGQGSEFILKSLKASRLQVVDNREFSVAHYTGRVAYDSRDIADKNRDFLPPEMVDALRMSSDKMVKLMFSNQLTRTGNLAMSAADCGIIVNNQRSRWGAALATDGDGIAKRWARETQGRFSQTRQLRTAAATFRGTSLDILRGLTVGPSSGGSHFVRCIRSDLAGTPRGFQTDVVRQQLRALAVLDTAVARQKGYSYRVPFPEFLRRYKFMAFDFDETVDITKDNSRLLLVRLKMEGWVIGKSKVFLKYYNEEYLARTYEIKVKKIIKVQTMMRAFLAKRNVASKLLKFRRQSVENGIKEEGKSNLTEEAAIVLIQKQYRGYRVRKELGPLIRRKLDVNTVEFIREYCRRWKAKTIFQVLLMYRAARQQDLVYFSQQVHLYNQAVMSGLDKCNRERISLDSVECGARASLVLGKKRPAVWKLPFRLDQDLPYFDTTYLNDPMISGSGPSLFSADDHEAWDAPLRRGNFTPWKTDKQITKDKEVQTGFSPTPDDNKQEEHFIQMPFCRDLTEVQSGKLLLQDKTEKPSNINSITEQKERHTPSPVQPYVHHKRTEVYNPGKAKRLEQRYEMDNRSTERENNNILRDTGPRYNQRNTASPTPQQIRSNSNNSNSRDIDSNMRYSKEKKWESPSPTNKKASNNLKNQYNQQEHVMSSQFIKRGGKSQLSNNPIAEMELKCRRSTAAEDSDEPPFNFQAMLRKTNTNRASLRRNHEKAPTPEGCNSRSSSRSKHTSSVSSINRSELKKSSWIENENHEKARTKMPWNETEQWSKYENQQWDKLGSTKSWNDSDNSSDSKKSWYENEQQRSDSMKSDSVKSWNKSEQEDNINSKKPLNQLGRSVSMESQNEKEKSDRYDLYKTDFMSLRNANEKSARYVSENSLSQSSLSRSNSKKSLNENEMFRKTDSKYSEKESSVEGSNSNSKISLNEDKQHLTEKEEKWVSEIETTTELVPGLIIQGQVADL